MDEQPSPIALAERITALAQGLGIQTVLIGAYAMAVHHYVRGTDDIDLGIAGSISDLRRLEQAIRDAGLLTQLRLPDDMDELGGVLVVYQRVDEQGDPIEPLEVVNFTNPHRPRRTPAIAAIRDAIDVPGRALRCPRLADLIALKLDTGAQRDQVDAVALLVHNPNADLDAIRATCKSYGFDIIDGLIADAEELRQRQKR